MKKNIPFLLALTVILACSPRKNGFVNRKYQGFTTQYNVLFNGKEALKSELTQREKSYKDNFYAPYIKLLTYEEQVSASSMENLGVSGNDEGVPPADFYRDDAPDNSISAGGNSAGTLQIAEIKALKAIEKHSMIFGGKEKNKQIFDAYILLTKARLFQGKNLEALDAINTLKKNFPKDKRLNLAKIYEAYAYGKMGDFYQSDESFRDLKKEKLKKSDKKLLSVFYSEMLLESGKKEDAISELEEAYKFNKNKKLRSRIAFLRGQILASLGENEKARESFVTAYKNARNFEFEVKSQIEIAKTFNGKDDEYEGAKKYLENISKKGTYASRKNEFYYALGLMANKAGKKDEAQDYFKKSVKEKISDSQIRGFAYYEIGKKHFEENDYLSAGVYYDSAYAAMNYPPAKESLKSLTENIKQVSKNYYLIKKNDSILKLTKMSNDEKIAYFTKHIETIKAKEAKDEMAKKKAEKNKNNKFETTDFALLNSTNNTSSFMDFSGGSKTFYFANLSTVSKGNSDFKQIWGNRALTDNWRTSTKQNSIEDLKNEALGINSAPNPRRFEPDFYIEKIPTKTEELAVLKKDRDTATLGIGRMYENFFSNTPLATKTLYDLVDSNTDEETELQALYQIFSMNYEKNPNAAERAKQLILQKYPYTSYAEFVKNPKKAEFTSSDTEVLNKYAEAYQLFEEGKYEDSKKLIDEALQKYPKDVLIPKFTLLQAFNTGKTAGKEIMILQLEQLMLNYPKTSEGIKAKQMLEYLKSDLKVEQFDANGNPINPQVPAPTATQPQNNIPAKPMQKDNRIKSLQEMQQEDDPQPLRPVELKKDK
ncbi:tetratricopeptide repeat protein [Cloacibacterium sp.]|uniref:type IX secretion system periplasmic lipoprotein PorW/SprE n=1 Tax=Cloacibacterium sp. TaxID=1913682 RepID=UPI0039E3E826